MKYPRSTCRLLMPHKIHKLNLNLSDEWDQNKNKLKDDQGWIIWGIEENIKPNRARLYTIP